MGMLIDSWQEMLLHHIHNCHECCSQTELRSLKPMFQAFSLFESEPVQLSVGDIAILWYAQARKIRELQKQQHVFSEWVGNSK